MESLPDLNRKARALESAGQDPAALDLYLSALAGEAGAARPQLLARAGLLQLRLGQVSEAAETLAAASDLYAEEGLRNNALALCERVIRADPARTDVLRRIAELSAVQGYPVDAQRARRELAALGVELEEPAPPAAPVEPPPAPVAVPEAAPATDDLGLLSLGAEDEPESPTTLPSLGEAATPAGDELEIAPLEGLEPTHSGGSDWGREPAGRESLGVTGSSYEPEAPEQLEAPEQPADEVYPDHADDEPLPLLSADELPPPSTGEVLEDLPTLGSPEPAEAGPAEDEAALVDARTRAAAGGDHAAAADYTARLAALHPDDFALLQLRAEHAFRSGDRDRIVAAYLAVARRFGEMGQEDAARKIYERVLHLDPENAEAREGARPAAPEADFVDLGALVRDEHDSTRFQVDAGYPTGDEERDFHEILAAFREQISAGIDEKDSASHYDLGLAFKEMGLWDDAITQLQRALRAGSAPVATLEVLGECFVEKGEADLAARTLARALHLPGTPEAGLVGIHYWLARSHEARGAPAEACEAYERVVELDPGFRDAAGRLSALGNR